jgi:hypothetical protein
MEVAPESSAPGACARTGRLEGARRAVLPLAPCLLLFCALLPARATAFTSSFTLQTGASLGQGSGVALSGNFGGYLPATVFPVDFTAVAGDYDAEVGSFFFPEIELAFGGDIFSFELLEQGVPTDAFTLTLDMPGGEFNPGLGDPLLEVRISRTFDGEPAGTGTFSVPLTTGEVQVPQCGAVPPTTISGTPLDVETGAVEIVGAACVEEFDGAPFGALFQIRLVGTLPLAPPVPSLSPGGLLVLAGAAAGIGLSGLRRRARRTRAREG